MCESQPKLQKEQVSGYFRANVGMLIINEQGLVLACERSERAGAWQLPQGGIDQGESAEQAAWREMCEEVGFDEDDAYELLELLEAPDVWFAYQLPKALWSPKYGRGQVQKFFAYRFTGDDEQLDVSFRASKEFRAWKWTTMSDLIDEVWSIRKPVYEEVVQVFSGYLA